MRAPWAPLLMAVMILGTGVSHGSQAKLPDDQFVDARRPPVLPNTEWDWDFLEGNVVQLSLEGGESRLVTGKMKSSNPRTGQDYLMQAQRVECHGLGVDSTENPPVPGRDTAQNVAPQSTVGIRVRYLFKAPPAGGPHVCRQWGLAHDIEFDGAWSPTPALRVLAGTPGASETYLLVSDTAQIGSATWDVPTKETLAVGATKNYLVSPVWAPDARSTAVDVIGDLGVTVCAGPHPDCSSWVSSPGTKVDSRIEAHQLNSAGADCRPATTWSQLLTISRETHHRRIYHDLQSVPISTSPGCTRNFKFQVRVTVVADPTYKSPLAMVGGTGISMNNFCSPGTAWYMRNGLSDGPPSSVSCFPGGSAGDLPVTGDWDGDGDMTPAFYRKSDHTWRISNNPNGSSPILLVWGSGTVDFVPVSGDWDGDGDDTPALYNPATGNWHYQNDLAGGEEGVFDFGGQAGDMPVVGDWNGPLTPVGDPTQPDYPGIVRGNTWMLQHDLGVGSPEQTFGYGSSSHKKIAGDWDGDGTDSPGVIALDVNGANIWILNNGFDAIGDISFSFGNSSDPPIVGDWDGGISKSEWPGRGSGDL
jgi:hypothetical protein